MREENLQKSILFRTNLKFVHLIITVLLSCISALFEGLSLLLLIPTVKGVIHNMDYTFVKQAHLGKIALSLFPQLPLTSTSFFIVLIVSIFISVVLKNVFVYLAALYAARHIRVFSSNLRKMVFQRYLAFGKLFFDRTNQGYLTDIIANSINQIASQLVRMEAGLTNGVFFLLYLACSFYLSWQLTLIMIFFFPPAYLLLKTIVIKIKKSSLDSAAITRKLSEKIFNTLSCIPLIKAYATEHAEQKAFARLSDNVARSEFSIDKKWQLLLPLLEINTTIGIVMLLCATAFFVSRKITNNVETFVVYFFVIKRMVGALRLVPETWGLLASVKGQIAEILKLFDDKDKFFVPNGIRKFTGLATDIEIRHLNFSYIKDVHILSDVTLTVKKGTVVAIVGPTGAGKTTLINLILRFYDCPPSTIFIDGIDIREYSLDSLMPSMALVSQDTLLFNDTLRANVAYGLPQGFPDDRIIEALRKAKLQEFLSKLPQGLDTLIGDKGVRLSGGERQRISIARALLKGAEIIVLDEATSSLDSKTEQFIQDAISEAIKDKTVIVIAHRLSTIKNAHRIFVIENGQLVEEGSLDQLLAKKGAFSTYWEAQKFY